MADMPKRKAIVKLANVELKGDYAGWKMTIRTNPPFRAFADLASGDMERMIKGLSSIIRSWNFVNEEGDDLGAPSTATIGELETDLMAATTEAINTEFTKLPPG